MATLPTIPMTNHELANEAKPHLSEFVNELVQIQARPYSYARRQAAEDLMNRTGKFVKWWHAKTAPLRQSTHKSWMEACKLDSDMAKPVERVNQEARLIVGNYDQEENRRKKIEEAERLRIATEAAQAQKQAVIDAEFAEVVATNDEERLQELIEEEARPVAPVILPLLKEEPISKDSTTRYEVVGTIKDLPTLLRWVVDGERWDIHKELFDSHTWSLSGMKALLRRMTTVDKDGQIHGEPPGITASRKPIVINRSK